MSLSTEVISGIKENCIDSFKWEEKGQIIVRLQALYIKYS